MSLTIPAPVALGFSSSKSFPDSKSLPNSAPSGEIPQSFEDFSSSTVRPSVSPEPIALYSGDTRLSIFSYQESLDLGGEIRMLQLKRQTYDKMEGIDQCLPLNRSDYLRVVGILELCAEESRDLPYTKSPHSHEMSVQRRDIIFDKLNSFVSSVTGLAALCERKAMTEDQTAALLSNLLARSPDARFYK